jgi:hypothetical protein
MPLVNLAIPWPDRAMRIPRFGLVLLATAGTAVAQPAPDPAPAAAPAAASATTPAPGTSSLLAPGLLLLPPTPPDVPSLRIEAARLAAERFEDSWRFPDVEPLFVLDGGMWLMGGNGRYRPRSARSAALHGGSMAATLLGEILIHADLPVAGVGALLTGATLDAAAADADRNAEARR